MRESADNDNSEYEDFLRSVRRSDALKLSLKQTKLHKTMNS